MTQMQYLKGMGAGLLVGACVGLLAAPEKKCGKRRFGKALKSVGAVIEDLSNAVGF